MNRKTFRVKDLELVGQWWDLRGSCEPKMRVGDVVMLNSGGPSCVVVDVCGDDVTIAWRVAGEVREFTLPEVCVCRVALGDYNE